MNMTRESLIRLCKEKLRSILPRLRMAKSAEKTIWDDELFYLQSFFNEVNNCLFDLQSGRELESDRWAVQIWKQRHEDGIIPPYAR